MVPYIALLIVLIVAVLFAVYKRVDTFEIGAVSFTKDTSVKKFYDLLSDTLAQNKATKKLLEAIGEFEEENVTSAKLNDLALAYSTDSDGKVTLTEKPISKALKTALDRDITNNESEKDRMDKEIASGSIKLDQKMGEAIKEDINYDMLNAVLNGMLKVTNAREAYVKSKQGNMKVAGVSVTDLYGAVGGVQQALAASSSSGDVSLTSSKEKPVSEKAAAPPTTPQFTKEVEDRIAKSVATQLKDSLLAQRSTQMVTPEGDCPYAPYQSNAVSQGQEYTQAKPSSTPDMSEYIRKDAIPCWNCSLP